MSNELRAVSASGTLYARIMNPAGAIWNGASFETYASANYSTYPVVMTEQGNSGVYVADFPSGIETTATYGYFIHRQSGGSPAEGDPIIGTGSYDATGASAVSDTSATLEDLATEGLKKGGVAAPSATQISRAQNTWMEELKADIYTRFSGKKVKCLQSKTFQLLTSGRGEYLNPSDFSSDLSLSFLTGSVYGAAQGGSSSSITLAASTTATDLVGRELVIYAGVGSNQSSFITAYDDSTKVATLSPSLDTAPVSGSLYLIADYCKGLYPDPIWNERAHVVSGRGEPERYRPLGDETNGGYVLAPTPYRTDAQPMVLRRRYYADLTEASVSGTLMETLYRKWRNAWVMGIKWKTLENEDDARQMTAFKEYDLVVKKIVASETYGQTVSELQIKVVDFA